MAEEVYVVELNATLQTVLEQMAIRKPGSVLVTRNGKLAGVFTSTDACRAFAAHLAAEHGPASGDDAA